MNDINKDFLAGLAQLETQGGKRAIKGTNNLYNIKDFSGGGVQAHDVAEGSNDRYRVYGSREESTADLVGLLQRKYPSAITAKTPQEFAQALKDGGYATDPNYVEKLTNTIQSGSYDSSKLAALGAGGTLSAAGDWDTPADRPGKPSHALVDENGNPIRQTEGEKRGTVRAALYGPEGSAKAAILNPEAAAKLGEPIVPPQQDSGNTFVEAQAVSQAETEAHQKNEAVTFRQQIGAASLLGTSIGAVIRNNARPEFGEPVAGFQPIEQDLQGRNSDDREQLMGATNQMHLDWIKFEQSERQENEQLVASHGGWRGFGASIVAGFGDPLTYILPYGAARAAKVAGVGSQALAASGKPLQAGLSATLENAGTNILQDQLIASALDEHRSWGDTLAAGAMGLIPGVLHGVSGWSAGHRIELARDMQAATDAVIAKEKAYAERAIKNLGSDATPDQVRVEMDRLQALDISAVAKDNTTRALPEDRRLLPDEEKLAEEAGQNSSQAKSNENRSTRGETGSEWTQSTAGQDGQRKLLMSTQWSEQLAEIEGVNQRWIDKQPVGVHVLPELGTHTRYAPVVDALRSIQNKFLPDSKVVLGIRKATEDEGIVFSAGDSHAIGLRGNLSTHEALTVGIHEMGHAVFHENARIIPPALLSRMLAEHGEFLKELRAGNHQARLKRFAEGAGSVLDKEGNPKGALADTPYVANFDEYTAEAFTRYVQRKAREGNIDLPQKALDLLSAAWEKVKQLYDFARGRGWLAKDEAFDEFFDRVAKGTLQETKSFAEAAPEFLAPDLMANFSHGVDILPEGNAAEQGEKRAIQFLYDKAEKWAAQNPMDEAWIKRADTLTDNNVFNVASIGLIMLKSKNPVVRMVAAELMEDAGGVVGHRQSTAAISKYMHERLFLGNSVNDLQNAFDVWKKDNGGSALDDWIGGKGWDAFNRNVAEEIESRRVNGRTTGEAHPSVIAAADSLEKAYNRMRVAQTNAKTLGWQSLPNSSVGYMPHKMSSNKIRALTNEQQEILHSTLVDQFVSVQGWDISFAANLASRYLDRIKQRALGGYDAPIGIHQTGASDVVEDALTAMGLTREEIRAQMGRYNAAGPGYTKKRLALDLNQVHRTASGQEFRLLDIFDTNQLHLLRSQAQRASGEVALARHGVVGKPGLALLRRGMGYGADGQMATPKELEAFDQFSAEMLGEPFGDSGGKWLDRARTLNSVARLGGVVFNQFAEFINGIAHVGVGKTLSSIGSIGRMRSEIIKLSRGERVSNPLLTSIEHVGGAEFGTDAYKLSFPFDSLDEHMPTYGRDSITATDRILRGAGHVQSKISFWRAVHSAQQRGFAEQIVQKAVQFIRSGADDAALRDMGINNSLIVALRNDIDEMATFDANGKLTSFDLMKAQNKQAAADFAQAIHRGVSQIIQGSFIGEQGKWAHSGYLKMLTQFRSFSILSVEKQWARQRNNRGTAKALGILVGSMSVAVPVYMARTYAASVGRADQDAFLEKQLSPFQLTRATMNYVALSGLAGDFLDALTAIAPDAVQEAVGTPTGGRSGTTKTAVGNLIAPAAGYVDDVWGALQNLDKPEKAVKVLPFSRIPYLIPAINSLGQ